MFQNMATYWKCFQPTVCKHKQLITTKTIKYLSPKEVSDQYELFSMRQLMEDESIISRAVSTPSFYVLMTVYSVPTCWVTVKPEVQYTPYIAAER